MARAPARAAEKVERIGRWIAEGRLKPRIDRTYPLADGRQALEDLAARRVKGKVVLVP